MKRIHRGLDHNGECLECDNWATDCTCTAEEFDFTKGYEESIYCY